jgi:hypothetical protein
MERGKTIKEQTPNLTPEEIVGNFLDFCQDNLGYRTPASVELVTDRDKLVTLASYNLNDSSVRVYSKNRALADILRSIAHELVHHKQLEDGRIDVNNPPQDVGGEIEDEANAVAGQLVKAFAYTGVNIYENWSKSRGAGRGQTFCQDKEKNITITDTVKGYGQNLIYGTTKTKENNFKPNLRERSFTIPAQSKDLLGLVNEETDTNKLKLIQEVIHNQLRYLNKNQEVLNEELEGLVKPSSGIGDGTVTPIDVKIMNHLIRDYSKDEIKDMVDTSAYSLDLRHTFKLYGEPRQWNFYGKRLVQFIYDSNYNVTENNVGDPLPPLNTYSITQRSVVVQRVVQDYRAEGQDTNVNGFMCGVGEDFWGYDPTYIDEEVLDDDFVGDEEWTSVSMNGKLIWDGTESGIKGKEDFNPYNRECNY